MATAPITTSGTSSSAGVSIEINYNLPGKHLPIQQHRAKEFAVLQIKHQKIHVDEYSSDVVDKTATTRQRALEEFA
jgi:hypothetical protein